MDGELIAVVSKFTKHAILNYLESVGSIFLYKTDTLARVCHKKTSFSTGSISTLYKMTNHEE